MRRTTSEGAGILNSLLQSSVPTAVLSLCPLMLLQLLLSLRNWNCKTEILPLFKQIKHGCTQVNSESVDFLIYQGSSQWLFSWMGREAGLVVATGWEVSLNLKKRGWLFLSSHWVRVTYLQAESTDQFCLSKSTFITNIPHCFLLSLYVNFRLGLSAASPAFLWFLPAILDLVPPAPGGCNQTWFPWDAGTEISIWGLFSSAVLPGRSLILGGFLCVCTVLAYCFCWQNL